MYQRTSSKTIYLGVQCLVDPLDNPAKQPLVEALGEGSDGVDDLLHVAPLLDVLSADTDPGLDEGLDQLHRVDAQEMRHLLSICMRNDISDS